MTRDTHTKEKLHKAAMKVFADKGYASSSVSDIVKEAGVARGTFYLYFTSKKNAFEKVLAEILDTIESLAPDESANIFNSPSALYERIYSSYIGFLTVFKENSSFARILLTEATGLDKGFDEQLARHYETHRVNIHRFLNGVKKSDFSRDFNVDILCEAIIGWSERCARVFASQDNGVSVENLAKELTAFEFSALCTVPVSDIRIDS